MLDFEEAATDDLAVAQIDLRDNLLRDTDPVEILEWKWTASSR